MKLKNLELPPRRPSTNGPLLPSQEGRQRDPSMNKEILNSGKLEVTENSPPGTGGVARSAGVVVLLISLLFPVLFSRSIKAQDSAPIPPKEYRIAPSDSVSVTVINMPEISREYPVNAEGAI